MSVRRHVPLSSSISTYLAFVALAIASTGSPRAADEWWDGFATPPLGQGMNDEVRCFGTWEGQLVAGGRFTISGGQETYGVAVWNGSAWEPLGDAFRSFEGFGAVLALTTYDGALIAAGSFYSEWPLAPDGIAGLARWDGIDWTSFGDPIAGEWPTPTIRIEAVAVYDDLLWYGGDGTYGSRDAAGNSVPVPAALISEIDAPDGAEFDEFEIYALEAIAGVLAVGGLMYNGAVLWDGTDADSGCGTYNMSVRDFAFYDGRILAVGGGGAGDQCGGEEISGSWMMYHDDGTWRPYPPIPLPLRRTAGWLDHLRAIEGHGSDLYVAGFFSAFEGVASTNVVRFDGAAFHPLGEGTNDLAHALHSVGPDLYVGGDFTETGGLPSAYVARWGPRVIGVPEGGDSAPLLIRSLSRQPATPPVEMVVELRVGGWMRAAIFDAAGRRVRPLLSERRPSGRHQVEWDGRDASGSEVAPGVYFVRVESGGVAITGRAVLIP